MTSVAACGLEIGTTTIALLVTRRARGKPWSELWVPPTVGSSERSIREGGRMSLFPQSRRPGSGARRVTLPPCRGLRRSLLFDSGREQT